MSIQRIQQYHSQRERVARYGGSRNESSMRKPFQDLLEHYAHARNLEVIAEVEYRTPFNSLVYPDGTLKDALRLDWGYWESKDEHDDLEAEIAAKFAKGYPKTNILFEDTQTAILYQNGRETHRAPLLNAPALDALLTDFVSFQPQDVREFRAAIEQFATEVPALAEELRQIIREQYGQNQQFKQAAHDFLALCKKAINPHVEMADVREMLIQHVLTQDIFIKIFDEPQFHLENNIARKLNEVARTFYTGAARRTINQRMGHYYATINARASRIDNHHEKQKFLKSLYENFYKAYNPKAADRLGIVYTPNEIVKFMIEATDTLCYRHFGKTLGDQQVHILDPATGTGTFITELIEYLPPHQLAHKYQHEMHCNEVSILPYYIANLNIEYSYQQKMGDYAPFENIVFVDTLDNMGFQFETKQIDFFHIADENVERIERQNKHDISVIIGNPPYNANQKNENENNKNRDYPEVDKRIKATYIKHSTAQKTKLYDMYTRFYRWASDRLAENGIIAFVTNRSFINARTYDGFRKVVADEFDFIYIVDLGGDVRKNPKLSGPKHNVFAIQTGVALCFLLKQATPQAAMPNAPAQIFYARRPEMETAKEKLRFLSGVDIEQIEFERIRPNRKHYWIDQAEHDWDDLLPVATKQTKYAKKPQEIDAIFELYSLGVNSNRDEWVYDLDRNQLDQKMKYFLSIYNADVDKLAGEVTSDTIDDEVNYNIKWSSSLKRYLLRELKFDYQEHKIVPALHRPYMKMWLYFGDGVIHRPGQNPHILPDEQCSNLIICFSGVGSSKPFQCLAIELVPNLDLLEKTQCLPLYRYTDEGERIDNITDFALNEFRAQYEEALTPALSLGEREKDEASHPQSEESSESSGHSSPLPGGETTTALSQALSLGEREKDEASHPQSEESDTSSSHSPPLPGGETTTALSPALSLGEREKDEASHPQSEESDTSSSHSPPLPQGEGLGVRAKMRAKVRAEETNKEAKTLVSPALIARARELRQTATDAEKLLWRLLRNRQLGGAKFRRQHPIEKFILDFYCHSAKLAIELDGGGHAEEKQAQYDQARTEALEARSIHVLRFWNNDVLQNTEGVLETILAALSQDGETTEALSPTLSQDGETTEALSPTLSLGEREKDEASHPQSEDADANPDHSSPLPQGEGLGVRAKIITKRDIFHYVYAVLHNPAYRKKYKLNLKREFPRIPFYDDFWQWAAWGEQLMELHLNFETAPLYPLSREDIDPDETRRAYKARLKADTDENLIILDTLTTLGNIPPQAWDYKLGNRSALEWVLDRYKERKPRDLTIREKFNTYRFLDYKEQVIELLRRVTTVSVETMAVITAMEEAGG